MSGKQTAWVTPKATAAIVGIIVCSVVISAFEFDGLNYSIFVRLGLWVGFPLMGICLLLIAAWRSKTNRKSAFFCIVAAVASIVGLVQYFRVKNAEAGRNE